MKKRYWYGLFILLQTACLAACIAVREKYPTEQPRKPIPTHQQLTPVPAPDQYLEALSSGNISRVWANEGGDKVLQEELRASEDPTKVLNSVWDGTGISLFGAKNEIISFNLVLEAPSNSAEDITVQIGELVGPEGFRLQQEDPGREDLFTFIDREIELFYIRYLQVKGISTDLFFSGYNYDEHHIPERCRRPLDSEGNGQGSWEDRPCHDLFYPEIAVPLVLESPFNILAGTNQSIWGDIYIPQQSPPGSYSGFLTVREGEKIVWEIPIAVEVLDFSLPDLPVAKTMLYISRENVKNVYLGDPSLSDLNENLNAVLDRHFILAHRHKISLIDSYLSPQEAQSVWLDRLNGNLFSADRGYVGPGQGIGNNVYSIGTYGDWPWIAGDRQKMWEETDRWVQWLADMDLSTPTEIFLYLIDESDNYRLIEKWANWINSNPGPGHHLPSLATLDLPIALKEVPSLDIPASWAHFGITSEWEDAVSFYQNKPDKRLYLYNSSRPATGSFAIEDEGTALRQLAWAQFKKDVDRWFYWEGTYYENYQCYGDDTQAATNVFGQAQTYGCYENWDESLGETGWNYLNGDGVLFYPGTDLRFPTDSYGLDGPIASLRLKGWRRGIQDVDYLSMAMQVDPERTLNLVKKMVPAVLWELGVEEMEDPTYLYADISWPTDPDYWENARAELAEIILAGR